MTDIELFPVIVTRYPGDVGGRALLAVDENQAPLTVDPAAIRIVRAGDVVAGDTLLAYFPTYKRRKTMPRSCWFTDSYQATPMPFDPACDCGVCCTMDDCPGPIVNLGETNPWDLCDPWPADGYALIAPAHRIA
ncbi:hypothetical protein [Streptomyces sp. YIM S03343]